MSPGRTDPSVSCPVLSCPGPPCPAMRRPGPTRPWYVRVLDSTNSKMRSACIQLPDMPCMILGHALRKMGLQGQRSVGTLIGSQIRRAAVVHRVNCLSTSYQLRITRRFVAPSIEIKIALFVLPKCHSGQFFHHALESQSVVCLLAKPTHRRPVVPRAAPPLRRAPSRLDPPVACNGLDSTWENILQRQMGTNVLVSSQERKFKTNWSSTICIVHPPLYINIHSNC